MNIDTIIAAMIDQYEKEGNLEAVLVLTKLHLAIQPPPESGWYIVCEDDEEIWVSAYYHKKLNMFYDENGYPVNVLKWKILKTKKVWINFDSSDEQSFPEEERHYQVLAINLEEELDDYLTLYFDNEQKRFLDQEEPENKYDVIAWRDHV